MSAEGDEPQGNEATSDDAAAEASAADAGELLTISYADAVHELEELLEDLERDEVDVDELAAKVKRAAALIRLCRRRITDARVDIDRIVADLDT